MTLLLMLSIQTQGEEKLAQSAAQMKQMEQAAGVAQKGLFGLSGSLGSIASIATGMAAGNVLANVFEKGFGAIQFAVDSTRQLGEEIYKLQGLTGLTAEKASELFQVFSTFDISTQMASKSLMQFSKHLETIKNTMASGPLAGGAAGTAIRDFGVSVVDVNGNMRDMNDIILDVADGYTKLADTTTKNDDLGALFGARMARNLIPLFREGKQGLIDMEAEAKKLGATLDQFNVDKIHELTLPEKDLKEAETGLALQAGPMVIGAQLAIANAMKAAVSDIMILTGHTDAFKSDAVGDFGAVGDAAKVMAADVKSATDVINASTAASTFKLGVTYDEEIKKANDKKSMALADEKAAENKSFYENITRMADRYTAYAAASAAEVDANQQKVDDIKLQEHDLVEQHRQTIADIVVQEHDLTAQYRAENEKRSAIQGKALDEAPDTFEAQKVGAANKVKDLQAQLRQELNNGAGMNSAIVTDLKSRISEEKAIHGQSYTDYKQGLIKKFNDEIDVAAKTEKTKEIQLQDSVNKEQASYNKRATALQTSYDSDVKAANKRTADLKIAYDKDVANFVADEKKKEDAFSMQKGDANVTFTQENDKAKAQLDKDLAALQTKVDAELAKAKAAAENAAASPSSGIADEAWTGMKGQGAPVAPGLGAMQLPLPLGLPVLLIQDLSYALQQYAYAKAHTDPKVAAADAAAAQPGLKMSMISPAIGGYMLGAGKAGGGIVSQEGLYPLAENNVAEAVIPLSQMAGFGGGGGSPNIYVTVAPGAVIVQGADHNGIGDRIGGSIANALEQLVRAEARSGSSVRPGVPGHPIIPKSPV